MTLEQQVLNLINEKYPPYQDKNQLIIENFSKRPDKATKTLKVLNKYIKYGYISHGLSLELTKDGQQLLKNLKEIKKVDRRAWIAIAGSTLALLIALLDLILK